MLLLFAAMHDMEPLAHRTQNQSVQQSQIEQKFRKQWEREQSLMHCKRNCATVFEICPGFWICCAVFGGIIIFSGFVLWIANMVYAQEGCCPNQKTIPPESTNCYLGRIMWDRLTAHNFTWENAKLMRSSVSNGWLAIKKKCYYMNEVDGTAYILNGTLLR